MQSSWCRRYHAVMVDLALDGAHSAQSYFALRTGDPSNSIVRGWCWRARLLDTYPGYRCVWRLYKDVPVILTLNRTMASKMGERMNGNRCWDYSQLDETWGGVDMARIWPKCGKWCLLCCLTKESRLVAYTVPFLCWAFTGKGERRGLSRFESEHAHSIFHYRLSPPSAFTPLASSSFRRISRPHLTLRRPLTNPTFSIAPVSFLRSLIDFRPPIIFCCRHRRCYRLTLHPGVLLNVDR